MFDKFLKESNWSGVHGLGRKVRQPPACPFLVLVSRSYTSAHVHGRVSSEQEPKALCFCFVSFPFFFSCFWMAFKLDVSNYAIAFVVIFGEVSVNWKDCLARMVHRYVFALCNSSVPVVGSWWDVFDWPRLAYRLRPLVPTSYFVFLFVFSFFCKAFQFFVI